MQLCGERKSAPCSCAAAGWATSGGRRPGEITGIGATRRRSFFVQGKESKRRRTGGTSSRRRRGIARKGKPFWREDSRDFPDPGRNLRFLHLPLFSQYHAAVSARPRVPREHCAFLCAAAPLWVRATLGGFAPYNPYQGTEFPGPSTFYRLLIRPPTDNNTSAGRRSALRRRNPDISFRTLPPTSAPALPSRPRHRTR